MANGTGGQGIEEGVGEELVQSLGGVCAQDHLCWC